jgi:hypothetical protein
VVGQLFLAVDWVPVCLTGHLWDPWHLPGMFQWAGLGVHPLPPGCIFLMAGHSLGMVLGGT